jgi:hypothetical protein
MINKSKIQISLFIKKYRWLVILFVCLISLSLHIWSVWQLPVDYDEPVYLQAGVEYAELIKVGDISGIIQTPVNREHPALVKLLYSVPYLIFGDATTPQQAMIFCRSISAFFAVLLVLIVALDDPIAGFLLSFNSLVLKYTSQAYLEALPLFFVVAAVLWLEKWAKNREKKHLFWFSAVALGAAVAGKLTYGMIFIVIGFIWLQVENFDWQKLIQYLIIALSAFIILNPSTWGNPFAWFSETLQFHLGYSQSAYVTAVGYPWYQPLIWISQAVPWHPEVFFFISSDFFVFWLGVAGLYFVYRDRSWVFIWALVLFGVLLLWPTKWPQYSVILIPAFCFSSAAFIRQLFRWLRELDTYWNWSTEGLSQAPWYFWVAMILFFGGLAVGKIHYEIELALARQGWSHLSAASGGVLPATTVNDMVISQDGELVIADFGQVLFYDIGDRSIWNGDLEILTSSSLGIPFAQFNVIQENEDGSWWFGSDAGLVYYSDSQEKLIRLDALGFESNQVTDLFSTGEDELWVATTGGLGFYKAGQWTVYTTSNSALSDNAVFSIIEDPVIPDRLWIGTLSGVDWYDPADDQWTYLNPQDARLTSSKVSTIFVDDDNNLWLATSGGGLAVWNGQDWRAYRTSNSDLPLNYIQAITQQADGSVWLGFSHATDPGGMLAHFKGGEWNILTHRNSGFLDNEPLSLLVDYQNRLWIGTRMDGIFVFEQN